MSPRIEYRPMKTHVFIFSALLLAVLLFCWMPIRTAVGLGLRDDRYVQILAGPFIAALLIYWERKRIFSRAAWSVRIGAPLLGLFLAASLFIPSWTKGATETRSMLVVASAIAGWNAAFLLCFGVRSYWTAFFPLCTLFLMVPVPASWMDMVTTVLQHASAAISLQMLRAFGVPVFAHGMKLVLPGLELEVAPECSGIHSCLSLALVALLASRIFLRSGWSRLVVVVMTVPISILKNALRISVIATLSAYVDRAFLFGRIHHYGGLVFTPLAVLGLVAFLLALQRVEAWVATGRGRSRLRERVLLEQS